MGSLQEILKKYHMEKWFRKDNLIVLVLAGILLVVIALPTKESDEMSLGGAKAQRQTTEGSVSTENQEAFMQTSTAWENGYNNLFEYTEYLEKKLESTLTKVSGVGDVTVMITLEASAEQIVEKDETFIRNNTTENDSQGGSRSVYQVDSTEDTIYQKDGTSEAPYVSKTILPQVSGVVIVAQGASIGTVKKSIVEMAAALFDIEVHKISVVAMEE